MNSFPPSSTFFTAPPHWEWLVIFYFFMGGLAGGTYFLAVLIDWLGAKEDRPLARLGYYIAFPCVLLSGLLLIFDLNRPDRFWHMIIQSNTFWPMFKYWSPMSIGSWALLIFGAFSLVSFIAALAEADRIRWNTARSFRLPGALGGVISVIGGLLGLYVAGYTGVLLAVTNRPIWSDTPLLGMLFVVSGASISAAAIMLFARRWDFRSPGLHSLERMDAWVIGLELIVLIALVASLGAVAGAWLSAWGLLLLFGVVILGLLAPLTFYWRRDLLGELHVPVTAGLVLLGGFLLRLVVVLSAQRV